jgi:uncharacterized protein (TIGR00725 family)
MACLYNMDKNMLQIGVAGSWRNTLPEPSYKLAEEIGREIAKAGHVLITGAGTGIMEHAMKGCKEEEGKTVGISAGENHKKNPFLGNYIDIIINTGAGFSGRIPIFINSCDGLIAAGGGVGTLTEISLAYHQGKPVVVIEGSGNISDKIHKILDEEGYLDNKKLVKIKFAKTAKEALGILINDIKKGESISDDSYGPEHCKRT